ncbi:MAG: hypothetical protein KKA19_04850 [Candidatus Margulisbacteria bacterium]|nr:hypothetical protein [Candidatus Margulisiibacteriota bacterium]
MTFRIDSYRIPEFQDVQFPKDTSKDIKQVQDYVGRYNTILVYPEKCKPGEKENLLKEINNFIRERKSNVGFGEKTITDELKYYLNNFTAKLEAFIKAYENYTKMAPKNISEPLWSELGKAGERDTVTALLNSTTNVSEKEAFISFVKHALKDENSAKVFLFLKELRDEKNIEVRKQFFSFLAKCDEKAIAAFVKFAGEREIEDSKNFLSNLVGVFKEISNKELFSEVVVRSSEKIKGTAIKEVIHDVIENLSIRARDYAQKAQDIINDKSLNAARKKEKLEALFNQMKKELGIDKLKDIKKLLDGLYNNGKGIIDQKTYKTLLEAFDKLSASIQGTSEQMGEYGVLEAADYAKQISEIRISIDQTLHPEKYIQIKGNLEEASELGGAKYDYDATLNQTKDRVYEIGKKIIEQKNNVSILLQNYKAAAKYYDEISEKVKNIEEHIAKIAQKINEASREIDKAAGKKQSEEIEKDIEVLEKELKDMRTAVKEQVDLIDKELKAEEAEEKKDMGAIIDLEVARRLLVASYNLYNEKSDALNKINTANKNIKALEFAEDTRAKRKEQKLSALMEDIKKEENNINKINLSLTLLAKIFDVKEYLAAYPLSAFVNKKDITNTKGELPDEKIKELDEKMNKMLEKVFTEVGITEKSKELTKNPKFLGKFRDLMLQKAYECIAQGNMGALKDILGKTGGVFKKMLEEKVVEKLAQQYKSSSGKEKEAMLAKLEEKFGKAFAKKVELAAGENESEKELLNPENVQDPRLAMKNPGQ